MWPGRLRRGLLPVSPVEATSAGRPQRHRAAAGMVTNTVFSFDFSHSRIVVKWCVIYRHTIKIFGSCFGLSYETFKPNTPNLMYICISRKNKNWLKTIEGHCVSSKSIPAGPSFWEEQKLTISSPLSGL